MYFIARLNPKLKTTSMRITLLVLLSAIPFLSAYSQSDGSSADLLKQGVALHDKKDYEGAIKLYDEIIKNDPNHFAAQYEKSFSLYSLGKYEECINLCKAIIKQFPKEEDGRKVYVNYGSSLDAIGKPAEAVRIYSEGIKKFPNSYLLYFNRGITQYLQKEVDKATADFQRSVSLNPIHASSHQFLAYCVIAKNKIAAAMSLATFLMIEPQGQRAEKNLKIFLQLIGSNVEKKDEKNITITLSPDVLDKKRNKEDDFGMTEMLLSMNVALDLGDEKKNLGPAQKLKEKLDIIAGISAGGKKKGFFTKFYLPFFKQLSADSLAQTAAYIIYGSSAEEEIQNWIKENKTSTDAFYSWLDNYAWIKNE
jgi:tetratricopeptide (TPR) repeat protein